MRKLKGMAQGLRVIASMKKDTDVSNDFTRVLAEDPPPHRPASIAGNSDGSAPLAAPVRHICTKCGTTVLFPPPMQRRTCSGCGTPMCLSQDPTNPVVEDPEPSQLDRKTEDDAGVVSKLKSWRRRSTNAGTKSTGGGFTSGGFAGLVGKVMSNESSVSVRNGESPTGRRSTVVSRISVKLGRASVFSNTTQASEVGFTMPSPKSALPEKPDFEDLLCVLLNLAAMVCSADLSDCNTVIQTFLWADAAALRTVTAKVTSGLETQQRQVRERRGRMSTLSETGCTPVDEIVRNFIETAGEHPDAKANNEKLARKGTPPRCATESFNVNDNLGSPKQQASPLGTPPGGTPNTTKGSQEFNAIYRSLSSHTGARRPSQGQAEPIIKEDRPLDNNSEAPAVNRSRPNSRPTSREGSPTQFLGIQRRCGSAESLGMKSIPINPDGGVPHERRISSATDISATSFSEFHQQKKTFSFASKNHMDQLASAKGAVKALLSRTKSFGLSFSPRGSQHDLPEEEDPGQLQQPLPTQPSTASRLKKGFSRGLGAKTLARGVSSVSVQSSTSKVSEAIRGLLRRQASKTACVAVGDINWGNDGSARDADTDRRIKQSQALAKRYQRKEPKRKIWQQQLQQQQQEESAPHPSVPSPPTAAASSEDRGDLGPRGSLEMKALEPKDSRGSFEMKALEPKDSRGSFEMKALEPKDSRGSLENGRSSLDLKEGKRFSDTLKAAMTKRTSVGTIIYGSEGDDEPIEGIAHRRSLFMFLVHELHIPQRISYAADPAIIQPQPVPEKKLSKLESQLSQLMLSRSMTGATDCTVPTAVLLDMALRDLDDPGSPLKQSPQQEGGLQFSNQNHLAPPCRPLGPGNYGMRKALSCEVGELTDILETSTAASGSAAGRSGAAPQEAGEVTGDEEPQEALSDAERWRQRKEKKKKQKQDPTRASYGAILRNSYEQNIDGVGPDGTSASDAAGARQAARNQVEADREKLAAITGGTSRASASNAPPPSDCNETDDQSIVALGIAIPPLPRAFSNGSTDFSGSSQATAENAEVRSRSSKTSDNNSLFSGDIGPCATPKEETEDEAMSKWRARKAAKAHKRKCQTKTTYGAILKMEHEQEMEFEGAEAPKPPLGQPSGLFGPAPPCGAPPPPLFGAAARDPSLLKATAASHSQSPTFGCSEANDSDDDANGEEAPGNESIPRVPLHQHQHHANGEDLEARLRDDHDEEERRWDAIRRAQAAEEAMENDDQSCWGARDNRYVDADAEVAAAMANAMRSIAATGRHGSDEHIDSPQDSEPYTPPYGHHRSPDSVSPKGSLRSGSDGGGRRNSGNQGAEERSVNGRESNGAFPGILRRSTKSVESDEEANPEVSRRGSTRSASGRGSCLSQKTVEFDFDSNEEIRLQQDESDIESFAR